jgi:uncharacterized protein with HEPN domain
VKGERRRDRFLVDEMLTHAGVVAMNVPKGREALRSDPTVRYALEHAIELLAEAAEKVSRPVKSANPAVPWTALRELRRVVAHPYDPGRAEVDLDQLWRFACDDLPAITQRLRRAKFPKEGDLGGEYGL